jgi:hypothetical protein
MRRRIVLIALALVAIVVLMGSARSAPPKGCKADCERKVAEECAQPCIRTHAACADACGCHDPKACTTAQTKCIAACNVRWTACINRCDEKVRQCAAKCT